MKVFNKLFIFLFLIFSSIGSTYSLSSLTDSEQNVLGVSAKAFADKSVKFLKADIAKDNKELGSFIDSNSDELFQTCAETFFYRFNKYRLDEFKADSDKIESNAKKLKESVYKNLIVIADTNSKALKPVIEKQKKEIQEGFGKAATKTLAYLFNSTKSWLTKKYVIKNEEPIKPVEPVDLNVEPVPDTAVLNDNTDDSVKTQEIKKPVKPVKTPVSNNLDNLKSTIERTLQELNTDLLDSNGSGVKLDEFRSVHKAVKNNLKDSNWKFETDVLDQMESLNKQILEHLEKDKDNKLVPLKKDKLDSLKSLVEAYKEERDNLWEQRSVVGKVWNKGGEFVKWRLWNGPKDTFTWKNTEKLLGKTVTGTARFGWNTGKSLLSSSFAKTKHFFLKTKIGRLALAYALLNIAEIGFSYKHNHGLRFSDINLGTPFKLTGKAASSLLNGSYKDYLARGMSRLRSQFSHPSFDELGKGISPYTVNLYDNVSRLLSFAQGKNPDGDQPECTKPYCIERRRLEKEKLTTQNKMSGDTSLLNKMLIFLVAKTFIWG